MAQTINPQFPHQCRIYRQVGATSFSEGEEVEIYSGVCRKSASTNIRTFNTGDNKTGKVDIADYRVSMPGIIKGIQKGDLVDVTDLIGTETEMRIVMFGATQLKGGGTEVLCNIPSN